MLQLEKIITAFGVAFVTFLLPHQIAILSLFFLVLINALAKIIAVVNDEDVKYYEIIKILKRSKSISYTLYALVGYSIAIVSVSLLELVMFGGVGIQIGQNIVNLTYLIIMLSVSHVFGAIFKSVEDILKHPLYANLITKMPSWLQEMLKKEKNVDEKEKNDTI